MLAKSDSIDETTHYTDGNENSCASSEDTTILLQTHANVHSISENAELTFKDLKAVSLATRPTPRPQNEGEDYERTMAKAEKLSEQIPNGVAETLGPKKIDEVLELLKDFQLALADAPLSYQAEALALLNSTTLSLPPHSISLVAESLDMLSARTSEWWWGQISTWLAKFNSNFNKAKRLVKSKLAEATETSAQCYDKCLENAPWTPNSCWRKCKGRHPWKKGGCCEKCCS